MAVRERFGTTLFLTTRYLDEADAMAERVMIIDHSQVIADDHPARLKADLAGDQITIALAQPAQAAVALEVAERLTHPHEIQASGAQVQLRVPDGAQALPGYLRELDARGVDVTSAEVSRPTLDDAFLSLTGRSLREEAAPAKAETTDHPAQKVSA